MAVEAGYSKIATSGSVFIYDTGDTINSYQGEPTTNLLPYSQQFDSWSAGNVVVTPNVAYAPDGTLTADLLKADSIATYHQINQIISTSSSTTYTFSCYVKPAGGFNGNTNTFFMQTNDGSWKNITFNLSSLSYSATAGTTGYVQPLANGWYRVGWTIPIATGGSLYWYFYPTSAPSAETQGGGYYIWGAQLEQKSHMTQYLPTTTTSATRSNTQGLLDISGGGNSINLANMSYDASAQPVFDGTDDYLNTGKTASQLGMYDTSYTAECVCYPTSFSSDRTMFGTDQTAVRQGLHLVFRSGQIYMGHFASDYGAGNGTLNAWNHITYRFNASTGAASIFKNGVLQGTGTISSFIGTTNILIGRWAGTYNFAGSINVAKIYNRALSDQDILSNFNHYKTRFNIT
jgi:hypothetical protein